MAKRGPKTKYTPETVDRIVQAIRLGAPFGHACGYAGIDQSTFDRWRAKYAEFAAAVKNAQGAAVVGWLARIEQAAKDGNWTAAAWKLERRHPEDFGRREKLAVELPKAVEAARESYETILKKTGLDKEKAREIVMSTYKQFGVSEQELVSEKVM